MSFRSCLSVLALLLIDVGPAHAFSDPFSFNLTPIVAGGGGRFFTGSPSDGYTCKTCHVGGQAPKVSVLGLPLSGYKPGGRYEVSIRWPAGQTKISLALELTDAKGKAAGTLRLPPPEETQPGEFCEPASDGLLAAQLNDMVDGREIINVPECESKSARFLWTAPMTDVGPVWFSGSMVQSDGEQDPYHDGVTDFGRIIGSPAVASNTNGECTVTHVGAARASCVGWALLSFGCALWRRSWKRRRAYSAEQRIQAS